MTDLASQNTYQRSQIDELLKELDELRAENTKLAELYGDQGDSFEEFLNSSWGLLYPNHPTDWEYPGQVLNHIRVELESLQKKVEVLSNAEQELLAENDAIRFILNGNQS